MISRILRVQADEDSTRNGEKQRGVPVAQMRLSSHRAVETLVPNLSQLPVVENMTYEVLQNDDGSFRFLEGYSHPDGPDH
ncbi:MAG: hypothetical protein V4671_25520 [Armatimonadota bacterium]